MNTAIEPVTKLTLVSMLDDAQYIDKHVTTQYVETVDHACFTYIKEYAQYLVKLLNERHVELYSIQSIGEGRFAIVQKASLEDFQDTGITQWFTSFTHPIWKEEWNWQPKLNAHSNVAALNFPKQRVPA